MKHFLNLGAVGLALTLTSSATAQPSNMPAAAQPSASPSEVARAALDSLDSRRLLQDRGYAEEIVHHIDSLDADEVQRFDSEDRAGLRLMALAALGRREEVQTGIDRFIRSGPLSVQPHIDTWWSALILEDHVRAVAVLEVAGRRIRGVNWPELRRQIGPALPRQMFAHLTGEANQPLRARLAAALLRFGWPGDSDRVAGDDLRMMVIDDRLRRGDANGAAELVGSIRTPSAMLPLIVLRRYDPIIGADRDRLALFRDSLADEDRETAAAIAVREPSVDHILARARYLRAVGRNAEGWRLVEPLTRDIAATASREISGIWLIDQAVGILYALDRKDEAVALNRRLVALPLSANSDLINLYINHISLLLTAGHNAEALEYARQIERDHSRAANPYGKMWIASGIACSLAALGQPDEAERVFARMRATSDDNLAAIIRTHICLGDMAAAEAVFLQRLRTSQAASMATDFQTFELSDPPEPGSIEERMNALRHRPAVQGALDRVARQLRLPLAEYPWY